MKKVASIEAPFYFLPVNQIFSFCHRRKAGSEPQTCPKTHLGSIADRKRNQQQNAVNVIILKGYRDDTQTGHDRW
jgi:hypothetical protein